MGRSIELLPFHDIESGDGEAGGWRAVGTDPQFLIKSDGQLLRLKKGHYYFEFRSKRDDKEFRKVFHIPQLYWDNGNGFTSERCINLAFVRTQNDLFKAYFLLPENAESLRFDPSMSQSDFDVVAPKIASIGRFSWYAGSVKVVRTERARRGATLTGDISKAFRILRGAGPASLAESLRRQLAIVATGAAAVPQPSGPSSFREVWEAQAMVAEGYRHPFFAADRGHSTRADDADVKLVAYYLPQFHPFEENERWWGKGFTEWTNVTKAVPRFVGHYQPKLPSDLGFYDLRNVDVMRTQADLAKKFGLYGFCFHFYWFGGHRLMETPIQNYRNATDIDFPYCLCWANENWTRRWDGAEHELLIGQEHSPADDVAFLRYVSQYFADPRYIKIAGRPVLTVYRPALLPDPKATAARWRAAAKELGFPDIYLVATTSFGFTDYESIGFDALSEFPPHAVYADELVGNVDRLDGRHEGAILDYQRLVGMQKARDYPSGRVFPGVMPAWDNVARRPLAGNVFHNSTPIAYREWLLHATERARKNPEGERFVLINAWNEWAEGAYLEPDRVYGHAYLWATASVVDKMVTPSQEVIKKIEAHNKTFRPNGKYAIAAHVFYEEAIDDISASLTGVKDIDLYLTLPMSTKVELITKIKRRFKNSKIILVNNVGRDILPFLKILEETRSARYEWICKIHSKKSLHLGAGSQWREQLFSALLGGLKRKGDEIVHPELEGLTSAGVVGPAGSVLSLTDEWTLQNNLEEMQKLSMRLGLKKRVETASFVAGSMFWFRPKAFEKFSITKFSESDFGIELGRIDGTPAHAMERLFSAVAAEAGYTTTEMGDRPVTASIQLKRA